MSKHRDRHDAICHHRWRDGEMAEMLMDERANERDRMTNNLDRIEFVLAVMLSYVGGRVTKKESNYLFNRRSHVVHATYNI